MRLFLANNFSAIYARELEKLGHEVLVSAMFQGDSPRDFARETPNTLVVTRHHAFYATWPENAPGALKPATPEDLAALAPYAAIAIEQIDRRNNAGWSVARLRDLYHRFVGFWRSMIDHYRPDAVVFNDVPHGGQDYVLYRLCKTHGIPTIVCIITSLGLRLMMMPAIDSPPGFSPAELATGSEELADATGAVPPAEPLVDAFIEQFTRNAHSTRRLRLALSWPRMLRHFFTKRIFSRRADAPMFVETESPWEFTIRRRLFLCELEARRCLKLYGRCIELPVPGENYVFFALHNQPEASTLPCGGEFVNQLHALRCLAEALPAGWKLYVKEHPRQFRRGHEWPKARSPQFYRDLAAMPNTRLMPLEMDSVKLIAHARAVATVTGTVGWEALQMGLPTMVFGYPWYAGAPDLRHVRGERDCRRVLADVAAGRVSISRAHVRRFRELLLERHTFEAVNNIFHLKVANRPVECFAKNYAAAIDRRLASLAVPAAVASA